MPASRAYSSSSGGAACPGVTQGQPRGSTPGVREWFQGDLSEKIFLWRTDIRHHTSHIRHWTDRRDSGNSDVDFLTATEDGHIATGHCWGLSSESQKGIENCQIWRNPEYLEISLGKLWLPLAILCVSCLKFKKRFLQIFLNRSIWPICLFLYQTCYDFPL